MGLAGHTDIASASIISLVGHIVDRNGLICSSALSALASSAS
jgi:hypothetical protein